MSTHRNIDKICVAVIVLAMLLTLVFMNGESLGLQKVVDEDAETFTESEYFTANDLDGSWDASNPTATIELNGSSAKITGNGAYFYDGDVVISGAGKYVVTGSLDDGSIVVDADRSAKVWVLLNGVDIYCSDSAAIRVEQAEKVFLTLAEGTENSLETGSEYSADALADNVNAALWSADDLTINGSGSLTVTAGYKHGIKCKDQLTITGGTIVVDAPQDGLHANDEFLFAAADLTVTAGDDAIHSDGTIYVESGKITVTDCYEGFEALVIDMAGGDVYVYCRDDGFNANGNVAGGMGNFGGMGGMAGGADTSEASAETVSVDETYIRISGGTLTIVNETGIDADGLDSNGNIYISGGDINITMPSGNNNNSIDYGSESGGVCEITGGNLVTSDNWDGTETMGGFGGQGGMKGGSFGGMSSEDGSGSFGGHGGMSEGSGNSENSDGQSGTGNFGGHGGKGQHGQRPGSTGSTDNAGGSSGDGELPDFPEGFDPFNSDSSSDRPTPPDWNSDSSSDRPTPPDWDSDNSSDRPTPPDQDEEFWQDVQDMLANGDFEAPDWMTGEDGEMPTSPDGSSDDSSERPTPPDMSGEGSTQGRPGDGGMGGFGGQRAGDAADEETPVSTAVSFSELSANQWIWLGASLVALVIGLAVAILYSRRR